MEKIELSVETPKGKKIFFHGRVQSAILHQINLIEREEWQLVLRYSKFTVFKGTYHFYPATLLQQLIKQGVTTEIFQLHQLDIDSYQCLLDLNTKK